MRDVAELDRVGWQLPPVHPGCRGTRLSDRSVRTIVADIAVAADLLHHEGERAGQPMVNPNTLRNTFAARLTDQGLDLGLIADLLGQATINPSRRPVHSSAVDRAAAIETHLLTTDWPLPRRRPRLEKLEW